MPTAIAELGIPKASHAIKKPKPLIIGISFRCSIIVAQPNNPTMAQPCNTAKNFAGSAQACISGIIIVMRGPSFFSAGMVTRLFSGPLNTYYAQIPISAKHCPQIWGFSFAASFLRQRKRHLLSQVPQPMPLIIVVSFA